MIKALLILYYCMLLYVVIAIYPLNYILYEIKFSLIQSRNFSQWNCESLWLSESDGKQLKKKMFMCAHHLVIHIYLSFFF